MSIQNPNDNETQERRAFIIAIVLLVAITANLILSLSLGFQTNAWQHFVRAGLVLIFGIAAVFAAIWIRRGRTENGIWLLIIGFLFALAGTSLLLAGFGLILAAIELVLAGGIAAIVLPKGKRNRAFIVSAVAAALTYSIDLLPLDYRIPAPAAMKNSLPAIAVAVVLVIGLYIVRRAWSGRSLRNKFLTPMFAMVILSLSAVIAYNAISSIRFLGESEDKQLESKYQVMLGRLSNMEDFAVALALEVANNPEVQSAFAEGDRDRLTELTLDAYLLIDEQFGVPQHQFHLPPATSFLRLHNLEKFDDDLSSFRNTVLASNAQKQAVSGLEIGRGGLGVRGVVPVSYQGNHVGTVEFGLNVDQNLINALKTQYGSDWQILLSKGPAEVAIFEGATGETTGPVPELLFQASTLETPYFAEIESYQRALQGESVIYNRDYEGQEVAILSAPIYDYSGNIIGVVDIVSDQTAIVEQQGSQITVSVLLLLVTLGVVGAGIYFVTARTLRPIETLTEIAGTIATGDFSQKAPIKSQDELGTLAQTFNSMSAQLQETLQGLEQRVAERTHNLELAAEVGRSVSQVRDLDVMLKDACDLILKEFDLYYVQVYLTDPGQRNLILEAGTGDVGAQLRARGHSLQLNTGSINGRAATERRTVVISDTAESAVFRPNPLLPDTRGEMAVPLIVGENVVGVLDMQTTVPGVLNEEVLPAFEALAGQLAVAVQNANLVAEAEEARAEVEAQARRLVRASWDQHLDAIHKPEQFGFVFDRNEVTPLVGTEETGLLGEGLAVSAPISLTGEALGSLVVEIDEANQNEQTSELVNIVARQVAQQLENLRLLEDAERFRFEAEQASRRQTREGWQEYIQSRTADSLGYLYDLKEVRPHSNGKDDADALTLPLKAREETVGKLSVKGLASDDKESFDLANAVAERLGDHIESLRLLEETKRGQVELDKRAQQLAAVAEVSTASSQEMDLQKMLETVVHLTQRQFNLYHAHVFTYREEIDELQIVACGYQEGDEHEGTHGTSTIPLSQEQSLVARAARDRQAVIVNDVLNEPGWLPNPLLPDTRAELAVPLIVGDEVLGVLDVQSDRVDAFTEEDANIQMTLASQVAIAMQNARSFAQAQKQAERETMLNTINQKIQSATSVEAVLQIAARELGHALGAPMTIAQLSMKDQE